MSQDIESWKATASGRRTSSTKIPVEYAAANTQRRSSLLDIWVDLVRIVKVLQVEVEGFFCVKQLVVDR